MITVINTFQWHPTNEEEQNHGEAAEVYLYCRPMKECRIQKSWTLLHHLWFRVAAVSLKQIIEGRKLAITQIMILNFHWIISIFSYTFDINGDNDQLMKDSQWNNMVYKLSICSHFLSFSLCLMPSMAWHMTGVLPQKRSCSWNEFMIHLKWISWFLTYFYLECILLLHFFTWNHSS